MTGPWHYAEAERLLAQIAATPEDSVGSVAACATAALAHATLAAAAATALSCYMTEARFTEADRRAWYVAASEGPADKQRQIEARKAEAAEWAEVQA